MTKYLQINYSDGALFQYSKTEQEGYEKHTNTKGTVSYRKIYNKGVFGTLKGVSIRDTDFGKEISVALTDKGGDSIYLNMPLFDSKKNLASYAESFITVLPQLKTGNPYRFYAYNIKEEGSTYSNAGISVLNADLEAETVDKDNKLPKLTYSYTKKDGEEVKGDIPPIIWEEDFDGSKTMNSKAKNKYLYDILVANTQSQPTAQAPAVKEESKPVTKTAKEAFDEPSDLPF